MGGVSIHVEKPHPTIEGITVGELGGPVYELLVMIRTVLNQTGYILEQRGYPDLGSFVIQAFKDSASETNAVEFIIETVNWFCYFQHS